MPALADEIDKGPVFLAPLRVCELQIGEFAASQPAAEHHSKYGAVSFALECVRRRELPEAARLIGCEPISKPHTQFLDPFYPSYSGRQFGTEEAGICGFVH